MYPAACHKVGCRKKLVKVEYLAMGDGILCSAWSVIDKALHICSFDMVDRYDAVLNIS
jgi:hypothetical protein